MTQPLQHSDQGDIELGLAPGSGFTVETLADLDRYLGAIADAGFGAVTLSLEQLVGDPDGAAALVRTHGLRCSDVIALRITRDDDDSMAQAREMARAVDALQAPNVLAMFWTKLTEESLDRLGRCADVAGAKIALEFGLGGAADSIVSAEAIIDVVGDDKVGMLADTFHFFRGPSELDMLDDVPLAHVPIVQFNDALPALTDDYMDETTNRRAWPGEGEFPLTEFADRLRRRGWRGVVSVEVLSAPLRELSMETFARRAYETTAPYWV